MHAMAIRALSDSPPRCTNGRRGAAAVEFAIILPVFLTLVLGCVDFGRFAYSYIAVTNAAREGAGFGMMNRVSTNTMNNWKSEIEKAVRDEMETLIAADGFAATDLKVTAAQTVESVGLWRVRVEVEYPFETIVSWPLLPHRVELRRVVEMRGIR